MIIFLGIIMCFIGGIGGFVNISIYDTDLYRNEKLAEIHRIIRFSLCFLIGVLFITSSINYAKKHTSTTIEYQVDSSEELINFSDTTSFNGSFFFGIGEVSQNTYYCYYIQTEQGYQFQKINASKANIYLNYCGDNETPRIDFYQKHIKTTVNCEHYWLWSINGLYMKCNNKGDVIDETDKPFSSFTPDNYYKVYIPKGSIIENYNIDLDVQ